MLDSRTRNRGFLLVRGTLCLFRATDVQIHSDLVALACLVPSSRAMDIDDVPPVDLDAIVASYAPNAAIARLLFVADRAKARDAPDDHLPPPDPAPDAALELAALRHAHDLLRASENTSLYVAVCERVGGRLGDACVVDKAWVDAVETRAAKRKEMLESELAGYKTNAIKESIRMGLVDLGDFHRARGDAANAFKAYARTRDYCTTNRHVVSTCLNVVRVGVESGNFAHVQTYCAKAAAAAGGGGNAGAATTTTGTTPLPASGTTSSSASTAAAAADPYALAELARAAGLGALHARKYALAARKFSEACRLAGAGGGAGDGVPRGDDVSGGASGGASGVTSVPVSATPSTSLSGADEPLAEILCARDVATCGALCGAASLDPGESRARFAEDASFRAALDHALETRSFTQHFFAHRFAEALEVLDRDIVPALRFDAHLRDHADVLRARIREKALARYCAPYARLDLRVMARAFAADLDALTNELVRLIRDGKIDARIDGGGNGGGSENSENSENGGGLKLLVATRADGRAAALAATRRAGAAYAAETRRALVRASLLEHDLVVGSSFKSSFKGGYDRQRTTTRDNARRGGRGSGVESFGLGFGLGDGDGGFGGFGGDAGTAGRRVSAGAARNERAARENAGGGRARGEAAMDRD